MFRVFNIYTPPIGWCLDVCGLELEQALGVFESGVSGLGSVPQAPFRTLIALVIARFRGFNSGTYKTTIGCPSID